MSCNAFESEVTSLVPGFPRQGVHLVLQLSMHIDERELQLLGTGSMDVGT